MRLLIHTVQIIVQIFNWSRLAALISVSVSIQGLLLLLICLLVSLFIKNWTGTKQITGGGQYYVNRCVRMFTAELGGFCIMQICKEFILQLFCSIKKRDNSCNHLVSISSALICIALCLSSLLISSLAGAFCVCIPLVEMFYQINAVINNI